MQRVMIVGQPGSGKSTLARALGEVTGLPVFHMDHIHYQAGWIPRDAVAKDTMTRDVHAQNRWIFEGGHSRTFEERFKRADTVIFIDAGVWTRLWRVTKRLLVHYGKERPDMAPGCVEGISGETIGFYRFIWRTRHSAKNRILRLLNTAGPDKTVVTLQSIAQTNEYLETL